MSSSEACEIDKPHREFGIPNHTEYFTKRVKLENEFLKGCAPLHWSSSLEVDKLLLLNSLVNISILVTENLPWKEPKTWWGSMAGENICLKPSEPPLRHRHKGTFRVNKLPTFLGLFKKKSEDSAIWICKLKLAFFMSNIAWLLKNEKLRCATQRSDFLPNKNPNSWACRAYLLS